MSLLIYTSNPYVVLVVGFCLGMVTGAAAMRSSLKARGGIEHGPSPYVH